MRYLIPFLACPVIATAEPQPAVADLMGYTTGISHCLDVAETADQARGCVGPSSSACMDTEQDGYSTVGMMFCTLAEYEAWDAELNTVYQSLLDGMRREDAQEAESFPEFANRAESLRDAQRAWIPLRDADCGLEYALWGAGSMRQIAGASCLLDRTAQRVIYLKYLGSDMQGDNP